MKTEWKIKRGEQSKKTRHKKEERGGERERQTDRKTDKQTEINRRRDIHI